MEKDDEVARFWQQKEEELGEPVLMKSISHTCIAGATDSFGILYASAGHLAYEYAQGERRSLLDVLFSRRREERSTRTIRLSRAELLGVGLAASAVARRWLRRGLAPAQLAETIRSLGRPSLLAVLAGTSLCVCTSGELLVCDTPVNRQWLEFLRGEKKGSRGGLAPKEPADRSPPIST